MTEKEKKITGQPADISATAPTPLYGPELRAGALVGRYIIEQIVHRGGLADLYLGRHQETSRSAAVKVLHEQLAASDKMLQRFEREANALREVRHPNVVELWDFGQLRDGRPYLAVEWLGGSNLAQYLKRRGACSASEAAELFEQLGAGLSAAHAKGIVHRDVKGENVMVLERGEELLLKLVDFGLAKLLLPGPAAGVGLTSTGMVLGTPSSMAPEQIRGEPADARTDIYALGILLFRLLTGQLPFRGATAIDIEQLHLHAPPPRPSDFASVTPAIDAVVDRCLQKDPDRRFQSVAAMVAELGRAAGLKQRDPMSPGAMRALGAYLELSVRDDRAVGEESYGEVLSALDAGRKGFEARGFSIAFDGPNSLLAAAPLPEGQLEERAAREKLLRSAIALASHLRSRAPASLRMSLTLTAAEAVANAGAGGGPQWIGGDLLSLGEWTAHGEEGVTATHSAVAGLEDAVAAQRLPGASGLFRIEERSS